MPQALMVFDQELNCVFRNLATFSIFKENIDQILINLKPFILQTAISKGSSKIADNEFLLEKWIEGDLTVIAFELSEQKKIHQVGKDFVANASHELRTPITIIKGFAETMKDLPEISDVMLSDITDKILRSCHRMDNLVKNLLLLADLDHVKRINKRPSDLLSLVESVSYTLLSLHPNSIIETLSSHDEIYLDIDPDMLEQAFLNLLENSVKYSKNPAQITIIIEKKDSQVSMKIKDNGVGIAEEHLPYIFHRFYRVNQDRSRKLGGAGLGLSIVQAIIEKHDGDISVESKIDEGTTFEIKFNLAQLTGSPA